MSDESDQARWEDEGGAAEKPVVTIARGAEIFDPASYRLGVDDAIQGHSRLTSAMIFAAVTFDEDRYQEIWVTDRELEQSHRNMLEIERVEKDGESGFLVRVVPTGR